MDAKTWKAFLAHMEAFDWGEATPVTEESAESPYYDLADVRVTQVSRGEWMARVLPGVWGSNQEDTPNDMLAFGSSRQDALLAVRDAVADKAAQAGYRKMSDLSCDTPKSHQMALEGIQTETPTLPITLTAESPEPPPGSVAEAETS